MAVSTLVLLTCCCLVSPALARMEFVNHKGERGSCVRLNECPTLSSLFNSEKLSSQTIEFLGRSNCEFDESTQYLCCVETPTQFIEEFDMAAHPKAGLLELDSCGLDYSDRLWIGSEVALDEFPWLAAIYYRKSSGRSRGTRKFFCGGSLINKRYVLTAAHCFFINGYDLSVVRLGEHNTPTNPDCDINEFSGRLRCAPPPQEIGIEAAFHYKIFNNSGSHRQYDIGLIRLDRDAKLDTPFVKPICLPVRDEMELGKELFVAGWGVTNNDKESPVKLKVEVPVVSFEYCKQISKTKGFTLGDDVVCAGGVAGKDSCMGDSGGPLMDWTDLKDNRRRYYVAGIVSFGGYPCGQENWPGGYTKVFQYVPWILDNIEP